ncbi:MAG TPA: hypothetical protein PLI95_30655 [Polyangiaceae bacterium]|nr:hypothetical protein [Polyangiaceae bacterium]
MRISRALLPFALAACLGCGGPQTATNGPHGKGGRSSASGPAEPQLPSCDDGTCFSCGDGVCPSGFYCETNKGTTGCASNLACPKSPSCDCLRTSLSKDPRCSCEDRKGVAFVTCK